jgi:hypothetical protein
MSLEQVGSSNAPPHSSAISMAGHVHDPGFAEISHPAEWATPPIRMKDRLDAHGPFPAVGTAESALQFFEGVHISGPA